METQHRHPSEKPLPPISVYVYVGLILAIVTAVEVAAFYLDVSGSVLVPIFIILSLFKFVLVVMFFMHLKYDHRIFSIFFTGALLLGLGVALGLIALFGNFDVGDANVAAVTPTPTPTIPGPGPTDTPTPTGPGATAMATPTPTSPGPGPTETVEPTPGGLDGSQVFVSKGCSGCHAIDRMVVGPALGGIATRGSERKPGLSAEAYIRESIEVPGAFVVDGFANVMPPLRGAMSDEEFEALVAYLLTLK
ncbi:MAG: cytochrome C oxidase subunit IV family protein [Chloroflexi bacterium]|nr:cytochrome C oxidase subunit IV family protein [Chloroflexota bacterium]